MRTAWIRAGGLLAAVLLSPIAIAADHADGTPTSASGSLSPEADITDVFAWMSSDDSKMNLIMDVFPGAVGGATPSKFSNVVKYAFHTASTTAYGTTPTSTVNVICTFN